MGVSVIQHIIFHVLVNGVVQCYMRARVIAASTIPSRIVGGKTRWPRGTWLWLRSRATYGV